ncbi:MAG: glycoside hydrolase family 2 TIM barrel-domain containing protein [Pseudomonadales bacterium]|jgi:beta-galactosidase/beta-glucuronidase|nr:glycoside hydrolase family 2 TIM barrel-domain containing protein [Pseudomonadales bacterium]MDP6472143.1 glycoside hydrolase family 2 TIM barrel-domain containing protein [Pseudomonadales bacterium]MDP6826605.1 glycoside hydrolase family 2 TIM barrel-domain containing protein [Pseudomonadales bacterium]MDP6970124.1 glycoside hydrolase family 2 TIM barrel-domain containing protein [Pseudomonadales bacterium]
MAPSPPRPEHPRPQFYRPDWQTLNGEWDFRIDWGDSGLNRGWALDPTAIDQRITVPFCPESALSGVGETDFMPVVWYHRSFTAPRAVAAGRVLLHFGAVDWSCRVWVNGAEIGQHRGGSASFSFDITEALADENDVVVRIEDDVRSGLQPAGKQSVLHQSFAASYTRTTGIWQSVWLEVVPMTRIESLHILPDWPNGRFIVLPRFTALTAAHKIRCIVCSEGAEATRVEQVAGDGLPLVIDLSAPRAWSPTDPHLYTLRFELEKDAEVVDAVDSYAGLRQFCVEGDRFFLNGEPIFLRLVLDQGFYPDGLWTAPSDEALRTDIEHALALGFNGARLHQKVFEERFHYWADRLGYLTWGEFPDWGLEGMNFFPPRKDPVFQERALDNHLREWCEVVERDRNHPSIITWTPFNEANRRKGRERLYDRTIRRTYALTKTLDPTRPVHDASGWTHIATDIYSVHDYEQDPTRLRETYAQGPTDVGAARERFGGEPGEAYAGQPFVVDEYGGTWWTDEDRDDTSWGYGERPGTLGEAQQRITALTSVLLDNPCIAGFCYTQLTDIEQEQNGLYTYDRRLKYDAAKLLETFAAPAAIEKSGRSR